MRNLKIALVGSGVIAPFHIRAIRHLGHDLVGIAATANSDRAKSLSVENKTQYFENVDRLLESVRVGEVEAVICAISNDMAPEVARKFAIEGVPVLLEKPGGLSSQHLVRHLAGLDDMIRVAYNRRFYENVVYAKERIAKLQPHFFRLEIFEPESLEPNFLRARLMTNGVHGLDLASHMFGNLRVTDIGRHFSTTGLESIDCSVTSKKGVRGHILVSQGAPKNTNFQVFASKNRLQLAPLEELQEYSSMRVVEPSHNWPVRRYQPLLSNNMDCWGQVGAKVIKPGFERQLMAFSDFALGYQSDEVKRLCTLSEAAEVLALAEAMAD